MKHILALILLWVAALGAYAVPTDQPVTSHFAWGGSLGSTVDLSGQDLSAIDLDFHVGYRWRWIKFAGAGVGAQMMVSNGSRAFPLYAQFRTNFSPKRTLVFWDLKLGVSVNYIEGYANSTGEYASTGIGFNVARGLRYTTHILLNYTYQKLPSKPLNGVTLTIGVTFH